MTPARPRGEVLALLADIKQEPDDDGLRLILADWLEDHGGPLDRARAELIRCQVEHARLPAHDPRRFPLGGRARQLERQHLRDWLGPLERWAVDPVHRRGLLTVWLSVG